MNIVGVIPARWASTRFKGKVLAPICGKPMVQHIWERASQCRLLDELLVACDEKKVYDCVRGFGGKAVMTSADHASGTDRIAEAVRALDVKIVLNIQGDEPLIDPKTVDRLAQALVDDPHCPMATVIKKIELTADLDNPNIVKVVVDRNHYALYFSRSLIPFDRSKGGLSGQVYFKHLGLYAYRKEFLCSYKELPKSSLEEMEQLEQLRALQAGYKIKTILTEHETISVDVAEDVVRVENVLKG